MVVNSKKNCKNELSTVAILGLKYYIINQTWLKKPLHSFCAHIKLFRNKIRQTQRVLTLRHYSIDCSTHMTELGSEIKLRQHITTKNALNNY